MAAKIDRDRLRVELHALSRDRLLGMLDCAIDLLPPAKLPKLVAGTIDLRKLQSPRPSAKGLLVEVEQFRDRSLRHEYFESFAVNSKNFMEKSRATERWIAECERLVERCISGFRKNGPVVTRAALTILLDLLRRINEGEDFIFFADEQGAWQVGIDWNDVLPVWFGCVAATAEPEEFVAAVMDTIHDFVDYDRANALRMARKAATAAQKRALRAAAAAR